MRLSEAKDKVLRSLVNNTPINDLGISVDIINAALIDLSEDKYICIVNTSTHGSGRVRSVAFQYLEPKAIHFVQNNNKFKCKSNWDYIESIPKRWGFILAFITLLTANIWQYISYKQKLQEQSKTGKSTKAINYAHPNSKATSLTKADLKI